MEKNIRVFEKEKTISFSKRTELIQFVSKYLALRYKRHLEFWRATAMDDEREMEYWENKMETEVDKLEESLNKILKVITLLANKFDITSKSLILKMAFKLAKIKGNPNNSFPINVDYRLRVKECTFEKIVYNL